MNPYYSATQRKIYVDFSPKSDRELEDILKNENKYIQEVIDIVKDIMYERKNITQPELENNQQNNAEIESNVNYRFASDLLYKLKKSPEEILRILVEHKGLDTSKAENIVNYLVAKGPQIIRKPNNKDMVIGAIWCIGGILVTAITYANASEGGGTYVVAWGAVIFGGVRFIKGLTNSEIV